MPQARSSSPPAQDPATPRSGPTLAVWEYAGLMLTYWCNARCAFCYVYSAPDRGGDLQVEQAVRLWRGLDRLAARAGKAMRVHLAGGEPFGDWSRLAGTIRAARDAGLTRLEKVETNAFWATDEHLTRARLELLDALGMQKLIVSTDVYHAEFIPFENVRRCVETARSVLGRGRVTVRWWDFFNQQQAAHSTCDGAAAPLTTADRSRAADQRIAHDPDRETVFRAALAHHHDRLTGRAAEQLGHLLPRLPAEQFRNQNCIEEVLNSRHVHIDPYGNVFPGVCSGIILGNALSDGVEGVWDRLSEDWAERPVVSAVAAGGSYELMRRARELGYEALPGGYADKCHLCSHVRQFLIDHGHWPEEVGPRECYAAPDERAARSLPLPVVGTNASRAVSLPDRG